MRLYEIVLVFRISLPEAKRKKLFDTIKSWLTTSSSEEKDLKISKEEDWGQKIMSYPIKKETSGHYLFLELETKESIPSDFEKKLLGQEDVIRHLVIRKK